MNPESAQCIHAMSLTSYAEILKNNYKKKLLRRDNIDIQVCKVLGAFSAESDIEHLGNIQRHIYFYLLPIRQYVLFAQHWRANSRDIS